MSDWGIRKDCIAFNLLMLFLLAVVAVVLVYFNSVHIILMFGLFAALSFVIILSYNLGIQKGLLASIVCTFLYGTYVIYHVLVTQKIQEANLSYMIWLFLFPVGSLLSGKLSSIITDYEWELNNIKSLKNLVTIDGSTGFYNNQGFFKKLDEEFSRAQRYHNAFALLLLKISNYNEIRIVYGEVDAGKILKAVADIMNVKVRYSDVKGLLDDEILSVVLTETNEEGAKIVVEKLHESLQSVTVEIKGRRRAIRIKPSVGVATIKDGDSDVMELFERAKEEIHYDRG